LAYRSAVASREHLDLYASGSLLDAKFTASARGLTGRTPAFAPRYVARVGATWRREERFKLGISLATVASSYWQDSDQALGTPGTLNYLPASVPSYAVLDVSGNYTLTSSVELLGGVANVADRNYYARVFQNTLEPAPGRTFYLGVRLQP
jgi:Fe(3+) dicitrate transport protein